MRKHPSRMLIATMVVTYGLLLVTILFGNSPKLGLDLQGGIAVNLQPVKNGQVTDDVTSDQLDQAIEIIRRRVDALGVAEPEVSRQGNTISVQLPGARDQSEVLEAVGKTARLEFRPVLSIAGSVLSGDERAEAEERVAELREELGIPEGVTAQQVMDDELAQAGAGTPEAETGEPPADDTGETPATVTSTTEADSGGDEEPATGGRSYAAHRAAAQDGVTTTSTTVPPEPQNQWGIDLSVEEFGELYSLENQLTAQITPPEERTDEAEVTLADENGNLYTLGPLALDGRTVETATSGLTGQGAWTVNPVFRGGADGIDQFNEIAAICFSGGPQCPAVGGQQGQLAIVLDDEILSAPTIQQGNFNRDEIQISGAFDRDSADRLAVALRFGSLPIELAPQQAETVSPTLGQGALRAGIISGLIGLVLVLGYLLAYYRLLGLATAGALSISASWLWIIMSNLGATVTLAGVVGIVASIGISLDSSIVFFENMKEEVRGGSTVRASAEKSFSTAYSTILKADISSLIGAAVLYWLSVGPVRGFAFYLGAATVLDLCAAYFFLRPAVVLLARSKQGDHPARFGIIVEGGDAPSGPFVGADRGGTVKGPQVATAAASGQEV